MRISRAAIRDALGLRPSPNTPFTFDCNICGEGARATLADLTRDAPSCRACGSSVRLRTIVHLLSRHLYGRSLPILRFAPRYDRVGLGISDWDTIGDRLEARLNYRNAQFHKEPRLDITSPPMLLDNTYDYVICTDVVEHIPPPAERGFDNLHRLLKPGGLLIFSVPYAPEGRTVEHFPDLCDFEVATVGGRRVLLNRTAQGEEQRFENLVFHGGEGDTLEMRQFSGPDLRAHLARAGFIDVRFFDSTVLRYGIHWGEAWSLPLTARKDPRSLSALPRKEN